MTTAVFAGRSWGQSMTRCQLNFLQNTCSGSSLLVCKGPFHQSWSLRGRHDAAPQR